MNKKYWVTTHWPVYKDVSNDQPHANVFIKDGDEEVFITIEAGDVVFIYESKYGRPRINQNGELVHTYEGKMAITDIVEVVDPILKNNTDFPDRYSGGNDIWWRYYIETKPIASNGLIPRDILNEILGYSPEYYYRGFGTKHSGVKRISVAQGSELMNAYIDSI